TWSRWGALMRLSSHLGRQVEQCYDDEGKATHCDQRENLTVSYCKQSCMHSFLTGSCYFSNNSFPDRYAATQLELYVDVFLDFLSDLETANHEGKILGDLYMYLLDEYQAGKARGANAVSPRRYVRNSLECTFSAVRVEPRLFISVCPINFLGC